MKNTFSYLFYLLLTGLVTFLNSCPEEVNPEFDPPGPVRILPNNGDTTISESGLRTTLGSSGIIVEWEKLQTTDNVIKEYRIFRSKGIDSAFKQIGSVLSTEDPIFLDMTASRDTTYYYYVTAVDTRNRTSDTSLYFRPDSVSIYIRFITLEQPASGIQPPFYPMDTTSTKPVFKWCYPKLPTPFKCVLHIANSGLQTIWIAQKPAGVFETCGEGAPVEYITYHHLSYLTNDSLRCSNPGAVVVNYSHPIWAQTSRLAKGNYFWRLSCYWPDGNRESRTNWIAFSITRD